MKTNVCYQGDCLEVIDKFIENGLKFDAILTDPPYGTVKGMNIDGWDNSKTQWDTILDTDILFDKLCKISKTKTPIILFSQEPYTTELIYKSFNKEITLSNKLIWNKTHFANPFNAKKVPVNIYEEILVFYKKYDLGYLKNLREYFDNILKFINKSKTEIIKETNQGLDHCFRTDSLQFNIPIKRNYDVLIEKYRIDKMNNFLTYTEIEKEKEKEDRVFNIPNNEKCFRNIIECKKETNRFHPTQKPVKLLEQLINLYTNSGDLILDFTAGSGSLAMAAKNTNRNFVLIEQDEKYCEVIKERVGCEIIKLL